MWTRIARFCAINNWVPRGGDSCGGAHRTSTCRKSEWRAPPPLRFSTYPSEQCRPGASDIWGAEYVFLLCMLGVDNCVFGGINSRSRQGLVDLIKRYISPEPAPWYFWRRVASTRYFMVSLFVFACFGACEALKVSCSRTTLSSDKRGHKYLAPVTCIMHGTIINERPSDPWDNYAWCKTYALLLREMLL
jgi:hypothetical protein